MRWRGNYQVLFFLSFSFVVIIIIITKGLRTVTERSTIAQDNIRKNTPTFVIVLCDGEQEIKKNIMVHDAKRQIEQASVLIKSAAVLTSCVLKFIVLVDKDSMFSDLSNEIKVWPKKILRHVNLEKRKVCVPDQKPSRPLFRVCTTVRLYLSQCLKDMASVIYLDTDVVFMRPPEELWNEFRNFDSVQTSGMTPCLFHYNPTLKIPYYGETGLNAGIWMMNLTRFRSFPGGWENAVAQAWEKYEEHITLDDQDIANIVFSKHSKFIRELECQWNYRSLLCDSGKNLCSEAKTKGVYLVHGNTMKFYSMEYKKIKILYHVWKNFDVRQPVTELLESLQIELEKDRSSKCSKVENIDTILTKGLKDYMDSIS